ncbi:MAG: cell division protein FtsX [Pseudomonadota bacterium]
MILPSALRADQGPGRVVPPSGFTVRLTLFTSAAMAFLAVFALALTLATDRLATRWSDALARTATVRITAPAGQVEAQARIVLDVLATTPGVASARRLSEDEERALLAPWLGPDLLLESLPVPALIEVVEAPDGLDVVGLTARLAGEAPGAIYDDHTRWRAPLIEAAQRLRALGLVSLALIGAATAAMITLAAQAALAANARVIATLRLVGARDAWIARAFVRRFTLRATTGALIGMGVGLGAVAALPRADAAGGFLTGLGFTGAQWVIPIVVPLTAALVAFAATRFAAFRQLKATR